MHKDCTGLWSLVSRCNMCGTNVFTFNFYRRDDKKQKCIQSLNSFYSSDPLEGGNRGFFNIMLCWCEFECAVKLDSVHWLDSSQHEAQNSEVERVPTFYWLPFHYVRSCCWASLKPLCSCQCHRLQAVNISVWWRYIWRQLRTWVRLTGLLRASNLENLKYFSQFFFGFI